MESIVTAAATAADEATGVRKKGELRYFHSSNESKPLSKKRARKLFKSGEEIEVPAAGAGSYVEVCRALGLRGKPKVIEGSSSAGDWRIRSGSFEVSQRNRYPYHGFGYTLVKIKRPKPSALRKGDKANFATLRRAAGDGRLVLVSAVRKSDGARVALVCAMSDATEGGFVMVPLAVMVEGNPYEDFEV